MTPRRTFAAALALALALSARAQQAPGPALTPEQTDLFREVLAMVLRDYVDPKTPAEVVRGALAGAAESAGPECAYVPPAEVGAWKAARGPSALLPLYVTKGEDFAVVLAVWPGADGRIGRGDFLRFIGGRSTYDMTYPQVLQALRGPAGERVECIFLKPDSWEMYTVPLERQLPAAPAVTAVPGGGLALSLPALEAEPPAGLKARLQGHRGPVLVDLRSCASGDTGSALRWAGWLLGGGTAKVVARGESSDVSYGGPGVLAGRAVRVLADETTGRGGEVLASLLVSGGATLVGEPTLGWAPRFEDLPLGDGGALWLSTGYFAGPGGEALKQNPLKPSVPLEPKEGEAPAAFLRRALEAKPSPPAPAAEKGADGK